MRRYISKRIIHALIVVWMVTTIVFLIVRAIPGNPVATLLGPNATPEARRALRQELGMNQSIYVQYVRWLEKLLEGDFGHSIFKSEPVLDLIIDVAEPTISIAVLGITIAIAIGISGGIISAIHQYEIEDHIATIAAFLGISMPGFWIGILLVLAFSGTKLFPVFGYASIHEGIVPWLRHITLPSLAVGIPFGASIMRMMRSSMLEVMNEDYMRTARAKGLDPNLVIFKHGIQNAFISVITIIGILFAIVLGGLVAIELVFSIQGFGRLLIKSLFRRDYPVIQGGVIILSGVFVTVNLVIDILYTMINPKIRYAGARE